MNTSEIITLARKNVSNDSSRLCLADAISCYDNGDLGGAKRRATDSLAHSVGVFSKDYQKAKA